jgi:L-serine/L-threonine ammonia-lyase
MLDEDSAYLHPFDDPLVWQGHATMVDEVNRSGLKPDAVVLSVGGGGLLCGVAEGLHRNGWADVPIVAVETRGAASFHAAVTAGHLVQLERLTSIATTLGAKRVCDKAFEWSQVHTIHPELVSDESAVTSCERFLDDHRILVEPACGASLAILYEQSKTLEPFHTVLVVVCGGATVSMEQLRKYRHEGLN